MLFKASYYSKKTKREIDQLVGKPFSLWKRLKMKGIGSQRLIITSETPAIQELIQNQNTPPYTNIELRPQGIILWFRVKLDNWVLVLPFQGLSIFKTSDGLNLYQKEWKINLVVAHRLKMDIGFVGKLLKLKTEHSGSDSYFENPG